MATHQIVCASRFEPKPGSTQLDWAGWDNPFGPQTILAQIQLKFGLSIFAAADLQGHRTHCYFIEYWLLRLGLQFPISLDYSLLGGNSTTNYLNMGTNLTYTNILDKMLDSAKLDFSCWDWVAQCWQSRANIYNAIAYDRNLARCLSERLVVGK